MKLYVMGAFSLTSKEQWKWPLIFETCHFEFEFALEAEIESYQTVLNIVLKTVPFVNPLSPNTDENEISLYIITTCSNIQGIRVKEVIAKDKMSWYLDKFSQLVP